MFGCHVQCDPWDLMDEGVDNVLDRLQGEVGASGIDLVVACDEVELFRPHVEAEPRIFYSSGGVYYQPNLDFFQTTHLKPPLWDQHRKQDVLALVSQACSARKLDLRLVIQPFHSRRLVQKHPEIACKNLFDVSSRRGLCLASSDVQEYLLSLIRDLSQYDVVSGIVLDEVHWPVATDLMGGVEDQVFLWAELTDLLSTCFNEYSLQAANKAGVDAQVALRCCRDLVNRYCTQNQLDDPDDAYDLENQPSLLQYMEWQESLLIELIQRLKESTSKSLVISLANAKLAVTELSYGAELIQLADLLLVTPDDLEEIIGEMSQGDGMEGAITPASVKDMELLLQFPLGLIDDAPETVRLMTHAAEAGARGAVVRHYGILMDQQFNWIHQGARNARRQ